MPDTVQGVIAARIDRLPADDKLTLQTAAVIGRVFQETVLAWLLDRQGVDERLGDHLAELERRELVRRRSELELIFKHAITQDVTYHSLLVARREELHRVTAEAIEALFPDRLDELSGTLAHHYTQAAVPEKALHYLTIAAGRAASTYSNAEAIAYYRAALDAAPRGRRDGHGGAPRTPRRPADDERGARTGARGVRRRARRHAAGGSGHPRPSPSQVGEDVGRRAAVRRSRRGIRDRRARPRQETG